MRKLIFILLILIASVWLAVVIMQHPGYILITYQPWLIQMPVWFAILATLLIFVLFYLLITSADRLQFLWFRIKNWFRLNREHRSYSETQHGLAMLIEAKWDKAEKALLKGINQSFDPLINYLGAARATHELAAYARRDGYIKNAYHLAPHATLAIGLTEAEFQFEQGNLESALILLQNLYSKNPRHPRILKLLEKIYIRLADWKSLEALLPNLYKAKVFNKAESERFEKHIYAQMLYAAQHRSREELAVIWNHLPRRAKHYPEVVLAYVKQLLRFNENAEIETLIRKTLKSYWQGELVKIYANLPFTQLSKQLVVVGAWLKHHGERAETLYALGCICARTQLWGKAKDYFERCLALGPFPEAALRYGQLLEQLGDGLQAAEIYKKGCLSF